MPRQPAATPPQRALQRETRGALPNLLNRSSPRRYLFTTCVVNVAWPSSWCLTPSWCQPPPSLRPSGCQTCCNNTAVPTWALISSVRCRPSGSPSLHAPCTHGSCSASWDSWLLCAQCWAAGCRPSLLESSSPQIRDSVRDSTRAPSVGELSPAAGCLPIRAIPSVLEPSPRRVGALRVRVRALGCDPDRLRARSSKGGKQQCRG